MVNNGLAVIGAVGLVGAGAAVGYFLPQIFKPKITITPNPVTPGTMVVFNYTGFPPNTALMSMGGGTNGIGSAPYNIGQTDQNGNMTIVGAAPDLASGTVVLYTVFAAQDPTIFATAIYVSA